MLKILFAILVCIVLGFFLLQGTANEDPIPLPFFLIEDHIANTHQTEINLKCRSILKPDSIPLLNFKKDYSKLWAHLNHLYETNDVEAGKEYYTEDFFKQINLQYEKPLASPIRRTDLRHELNIENWSDDGLVCTVTDSNLVMLYTYPDGCQKYRTLEVAMALLFQGDHWRIDALKIKKN